MLQITNFDIQKEYRRTFIVFRYVYLALESADGQAPLGLCHSNNNGKYTQLRTLVPDADILGMDK